MTIQTKIHDGIGVKTYTYRDVYSITDLDSIRDGFLAQRSFSKWGVMTKLIGKTQKTLMKFGRQ